MKQRTSMILTAVGLLWLLGGMWLWSYLLIGLKWAPWMKEALAGSCVFYFFFGMAVALIGAVNGIVGGKD